MTPLDRTVRDYCNHHLDSTRWRHFEPRDGDIIVTTSYKSGTTWMQQILHLLVFKGDPDVLPVGLVSPWLDARFHGPVEEVAAGLAAQRHQRFVKSHLPFDGLPYYENAKYIVVARDARDVFMSLWNHFNNYTDGVMERLNERSGWSGEDFPHPRDFELRDLWRSWMTRGWFEWESEGWPYWGNLSHTQSYWDWRELPNFLFVHYADLLADPSGQIRRTAEFAGISLSEEELAMVVERSSIDAMRAEMKATSDDQMRIAFKGGVDAFVYKGTNERWRGVLNDEDLALYDAAAERVLTPECAAWLRSGSLGSG